MQTKISQLTKKMEKLYDDLKKGISKSSKKIWFWFYTRWEACGFFG
jgi:hypothetical protein